MTASSESDIAGVVAPPPAIYGGAFVAGLGLNALLPSPRIPTRVAWPVGLLLLTGGGFLGGSFIAEFRRAHTPVDVRRPTTSLVTTGPYRITRNPAYLGLALTYAGIATLARTPWAVVTLVPALVVMDRMVIAREERYLERRFGKDYLRYKSRTRRWL
jgi:protein-S-isoprenylcysteine O-methyltransferase Ste14